jgi:hypothetical protein
LKLPVRPADLKWPYSGIVHDIRSAISGKANFLAALGLLVYTEVIGRRIVQALGIRNPSNKDSFYFYYFYERYMGKRGAQRQKIYEHFRHGLAHGYAFNAADRSRVRMRSDPNWIPADSRSGAISFQRRRIKSLLVNAYFRDFQRGLAKWTAEHPGLVRGK